MGYKSDETQTQNGAIYYSNKAPGAAVHSGGNCGFAQINFDASLSSSTYQDGASVYPNSVSTLLIIKH